MKPQRPPCPCGACPSCALRRAYARGTKRYVPRWDTWTLDQDEWLQAHAGTQPLKALAASYAAKFGFPRTRNALAMRLKHLGLSRRVEAFSLLEISRLFRVREPTIKRWWVDPGLLAGERLDHTHGPYPQWSFGHAALERFIRQHSHAYRWQRMRPGRWRALAEIVNRPYGWLTCTDAARVIGIHPRTLVDWLRAGRVPHQRRYGHTGDGTYVIRRADAVAARA